MLLTWHATDGKKSTSLPFVCYLTGDLEKKSISLLEIILSRSLSLSRCWLDNAAPVLTLAAEWWLVWAACVGWRSSRSRWHAQIAMASSCIIIHLGCPQSSRRFRRDIKLLCCSRCFGHQHQFIAALRRPPPMAKPPTLLLAIFRAGC